MRKYAGDERGQADVFSLFFFFFLRGVVTRGPPSGRLGVSVYKGGVPARRWSC